MLKVLVAVPGQDIEIKEIAEGMAPIHELVGGSPECVRLGNGFILYCNHDESRDDFIVNPHFAQGIVKGNFVIARAEQDRNSAGLDADDIEWIMNNFIRTSTT